MHRIPKVFENIARAYGTEISTEKPSREKVKIRMRVELLEVVKRYQYVGTIILAGRSSYENMRLRIVIAAMASLKQFGKHKLLHSNL